MTISDAAVAAAAKTFFRYEYARFTEEELAYAHKVASEALEAAAAA